MSDFTTTARIEISDSRRYLRQLCRHFGHKVETSFEEHGQSGHITFDGGRGELDATDAEVLIATVTAPDAAAAEQYAGVIDRHLVKFAFREELTIEWSPAVEAATASAPADEDAQPATA